MQLSFGFAKSGFAHILELRAISFGHIEFGPHLQHQRAPYHRTWDPQG